MNRRTFLATSGTLAAGAPFASRLSAATPPAAAKSPPAAPAPPPLAPRFGDARDWWFEKQTAVSTQVKNLKVF